MKKTALLIDGAYLRAVATKHHGFDSANYTADFIEKFARAWWKILATSEQKRLGYFVAVPQTFLLG